MRGGRDLLREYRSAGRAQARLLPAQAGGNRPDVRDLAGAEAVDIRRAGPALFWGALLGAGRTACDQREQETERRSPAVTKEKCRTSRKACRHRCVSLDHPRLDKAGVIQADTRTKFCKK